MPVFGIWSLFLSISLCVQYDADQIADHYTDSRDGQIYPTVVIGDRIWFGKNLNYVTPNSVCYDHQALHCDKYGRLYPIDEARIACPEQWRLPDSNDIVALHALMKTKKISQIAVPDEWQVKGSEKFNNALGLSILPAGRIDMFSVFSAAQDRWIDTVAFHQLETAASFWLQSEIHHRGILHWHLGSPIGEVKSGLHRHDISPELHRFSVRCVCDVIPAWKRSDEFPDSGLSHRQVVSRADLSGMPFQQGIYVIAICIDQTGIVVSAEYDKENSSIADRAAIDKAVEYAKQYRFAPDPDAPMEDCGRLTFVVERK